MKIKIVLYVALICVVVFFLSCVRRRKNTFETDRSSPGIERLDQQKSTRNSQRGVKTVIKMKKQNGVYFVPCKINDTEMEFIFDTGASDITMSMTEATFLYKQGKLLDEDFLGTQRYQIADGSIAEGTVVNLQKVTIGKRTIRNVKATIVHNMEAPLLLGQSALATFGKISIDYTKNEIIFE